MLYNIAITSLGVLLKIFLLLNQNLCSPSPYRDTFLYTQSHFFTFATQSKASRRTFSHAQLNHRLLLSKYNKLSEGANSCKLSFNETLRLSRDKLAFHSSRK